MAERLEPGQGQSEEVQKLAEQFATAAQVATQSRLARLHHHLHHQDPYFRIEGLGALLRYEL